MPDPAHTSPEIDRISSEIDRTSPTDRLLGILLELKATRWKRAADLADLFSVSTRTIYRDMQALDAAGVPLVAVPGKGYSLSEAYFLAPLIFSNDEAVMLLLGADFLADHFEVTYRNAAKAAALKLEAALPEALRDTVEQLRERVRFVPVNAFEEPTGQAALAMLRRALAEARAVRIRISAGDPVTVHPYGLLEQNGMWTLLGRDADAGRVRHFRLGDMDAVELLDATFKRPAGYRHVSAEAGRDVVVEVVFDAAVAAWVRDTPSFYLEDSETRPDGLHVTLRVRRETEVIPWLLGWGAHARVLAPASLRRRLAREAEAIAAHYREAPALF